MNHRVAAMKVFSRRSTAIWLTLLVTAAVVTWCYHTNGINNRNRRVVTSAYSTTSSHTRTTSTDTTETTASPNDASYGLPSWTTSCSSSMIAMYEEPETIVHEDDLVWCRTKQAAYRIIIGKSYGQAPKHMQREWENRMCNDLITNKGNVRSCSEKYGWGYVYKYLDTATNVLAGPTSPLQISGRAEVARAAAAVAAGAAVTTTIGSRVNCAEDAKASLLCGFHRVVVDFVKAPVVGIHRQFHPGFVTAFGEPAKSGAGTTARTFVPKIPGYILEPLEHSPYSCRLRRRDNYVNFNETGDCVDVIATINAAAAAAAAAANATFTSSSKSVFAPGSAATPTSNNNNDNISSGYTCDEFERRPTFVMSHDDIYNLAHHMNDVAMVWVMSLLSGRALNESLFITMDGIRSGGPSGKQNHRLVNKSQADALSPFNNYYRSWFQEVRRGISYGQKRVCFAEIYFQPFPGLAWIWSDWTRPNLCSLKTLTVAVSETGLAHDAASRDKPMTIPASVPSAPNPIPSPLFQSLSWQIRSAWTRSIGSLPFPPTAPGALHVVILVRKQIPWQQQQGGNIRVVANMGEVVHAVKEAGRILEKSLSSLAFQIQTSHTIGKAATSPGSGSVTVTVQDFSLLSFEEQVRLAHSASVFIGMHGAALPHIFNAAIGAPNCCSVVEIFPERSKGFSAIHGFGNMARLLGMYYYRYVVSDGQSDRHSGSTVDIKAIMPVLTDALRSVAGHRICLHDVRTGVADTSTAINMNSSKFLSSVL